jgi:two-component system, NtrC family, response regulator AtoC
MTYRLKHSASILVVDDDKAFRIATTAVLSDTGYAVDAVTSARDAIEKLKSYTYDLILSDLVMSQMDGLQLLEYIRTHYPDIPIIMITGFGSIESAVKAMKAGAYDYLTKPCNNDELRIKVSRALDYEQNRQALSTLREEVHKLYTFHNIQSRSRKMREIFDLVGKVADTDVTVLIRGETGTGKELIAKAIHFNSPRRDKSFITVNCAAMPEQLFESELFGHVKGAFTGADKDRKGRAEDADGGTLFLDEIGYIPLSVQTKLLRFLQDKSYDPVGGSATRTSDVRIIAATNQSLEDMIAGGTFRNDLFYRLNIFPLTVPPLRERLEDIPLLAEYFIQKYSKPFGRKVVTISSSVISSMMNYTWRGNIRELENIIKRAIIKNDGDCITSIDLPMDTYEQFTNITNDIVAAADNTISFKNYMKSIRTDAELKYLITALKASRGNINRTARMMDVDRKTIYRKLSEYGIDIEQFR